MNNKQRHHKKVSFDHSAKKPDHRTVKHVIRPLKTRSKHDTSDKKVDHRDRGLNKKASDAKRMWEKMLNSKESKKLIRKSWTSSNPMKEYKKTIVKLADKIEKNKT